MKKMRIIIVLIAMMAGIAFVVNVESVEATTLTIKKAKSKKAAATIRAHQTLKIKVKGVKTKKIRWKVSNKKVASISKTGMLTGKKKGTVIVTAKTKKKKYQCKIKVKKANTLNQYAIRGSSLKQGIYLLDDQYENKNIIVSPLSLNMVLGMASNGCADSTSDGQKMPSLSVFAKKQIENYLGMSTVKYNEHTKKIMDSCKDDKVLDVANSVWYRDILQINEKFEQDVKKYYSAEIFGKSFESDTIDEINRWIEEKTDGRVKKMIENIETNMVAYLINTLLFKGKWTDKVESYNVIDEKFTQFNGKKENVKMLRCQEHGYYENDYAVAFEKTYEENKRYSFIGILPKAKGQFQLENLNIHTLLKNHKSGSVDVKFPKFSYQWKKSIKNSVAHMGITTLFDKNSNPLSNMFINSTMSIYASDVIQCCNIDVDEKGTEAAAVTILEAKCTAAIITPEKNKSIILNRPFAYLIRDNETGEILFTGKVVNPLQK